MDTIKEGYRKTEVGIIPEDWQVIKFSDVTDLITCGIAATPKYVQDNIGFPFLSSTNVKQGKVVWSNYKYIERELHHRLYLNNPPKRGDILYSRVGSIGEAAVIETDIEFSIYVSLTLIKPKEVLDSYYLKHLLNSDEYKQRAKNQVYLGGGVGNLNVKVVQEYPIVVPPLKEQQAVADALSEVDEQITALNDLIAKKRDIKHGAMQDLLTGRERLSDFEVKKGYKQTEVGIIPNDWSVNAIAEVSSIISSGTTPSRSLHGRYFENGTINWVKTLDLNNGSITQTEESITNEALKETSLKINPIGTVLVAMYGGFNQIGRTGILRIPATINQAITAIQVNKNILNSDYLIAYLNYKIDYWKIVASSSRKDPNITGKDVKQFPVAVPPTIEEQHAIAYILADSDKEINTLEEQRDKTIAIKQGMMQELLTGKTRLI